MPYLSGSACQEPSLTSWLVPEKDAFGASGSFLGFTRPGTDLDLSTYASLVLEPVCAIYITALSVTALDEPVVCTTYCISFERSPANLHFHIQLLAPAVL